MILHVVSSLKRSGPVNVLLSLLRNLDWPGQIITLADEPANSMLPEFRAHNISVYRLAGARFDIPALTRRLNHAVDRLGGQIIHTHGIRADLIASFSRHRSKWVSTVHCEIARDYRMTYGYMRGQVGAMIHQSALRSCRHVVACSQSVTGYLEQIGIPSHAVPNGVETTIFAPALNSEQLRRQLGFKVNESIVVSVGHLSARKDPLTVVDAFGRQSRFDRLVMIGDGPLRWECESRADDRVQFTGRISNVADYLQIAEVLVSASRLEGLPMAVLEAQACGVPALLSDIPAHRFLAKHGGCRLFPCGQPDALRQCLDEMKPDWLAAAGRSARAAVEAQFSASRMAERYANIYRSIQRRQPARERAE